MFQSHLGRIVLFYFFSDGIEVTLYQVGEEAARLHTFSSPMQKDLNPGYLLLKFSNPPENESYNRFAPPSAQAFQEDALQSFHKSPREKGWLRIISADLLDETDELSPSRKDGAHLREVIFGGTGEDVGQKISEPLTASSVPTSSSASTHKMGKITVLYFAAATTVLGLTSETFVLPDGGLKLSDLAKLIASRHPNAGIDRVLQQSRWSVDTELIYLPDSVVLRGGEEVAVIPPVSGG